MHLAITVHDALRVVPDGDDVLYADLWFEDTLGRSHPMKGTKDALRNLLSDVPSAPTSNRLR